MGKGRLPLGHEMLSALGFGFFLPPAAILSCDGGYAKRPTAASIGSRFYARDKGAKGVCAIILLNPSWRVGSLSPASS
jgi:hypothetical protein